MKKLFFLIFINCANCFSQTVEVKYFENEINLNSGQLKELPKNLQIIYKPNFYSYKLLTDGKVSKYQNEKINIEFEDEVSETSMVTEDGDTIKTFISSTGFDTKIKEKLIFKNYQKNEIYEELFFDEKINIVDDLIDWNWEVLEETQTILGYKCKKATSNKFGNPIYVWFTDEIPISDGPQKFTGLPGLILKVQLKSIEVIAYEVKFNKEKFEIQQPIYHGKVFTYNEFLDKMNKRNK